VKPCLTSLESYHRRYGLSHRRLALCGQGVAVAPPRAGNRAGGNERGVAVTQLFSLVDEQVTQRHSDRMALLYIDGSMRSPPPLELSAACASEQF